MNHVLEANNSHNGMNSVIRSGGCDVSSIDEVVGTKVEAFTSHYGSYEVENHGSSEHLTAAQCLYRAFMSSGGQNMNSHQGSYQTSVTSQQSSYQSMNAHQQDAYQSMSAQQDPYQSMKYSADHLTKRPCSAEHLP